MMCRRFILLSLVAVSFFILGCDAEKSTEILPPTGVGRTEIRNTEGVTFRLLGNPRSIGGLQWPQTNGAFDKQAAFRGPCLVHVALPGGRDHKMSVVGGLLTQKRYSIVHALLYLTGPPVSLDAAVRLIEDTATRFSISQETQYKQFLGRIREQSPKPGFGNDFFATVPLIQDVELSFALTSSYDEKGWYVQVVLRHDPE